MSDSTSNAKPDLWMIVDTSSETLSDGSEGGKGFSGGYWGDSDEETNDSAQVLNNGKVSLPTDKLQGNLNQFLGIVKDLFTKAEEVQNTQQVSETPQKPNIQLDQIEFSVGINSEGEVGFWGLAKGKVGGVTQIKLTFKRKE